jgi:hypothetical protein
VTIFHSLLPDSTIIINRNPMFEIQGAKPGESGMRQAAWQSDGSLDLYNQTEAYDIPPGCYSDLVRCPPCEIRVGPSGRGIWVKPVLPNELIPRRGTGDIVLLVGFLDSQPSWNETGAVMMRLAPHVTALTTQYLGSYCSACHEEQKATQPLRRCQQCRVILYCDEVRHLNSFLSTRVFQVA